MRFAIYEPEPVVCGPMVWARHLKTGFQKLGHGCDVVTFTRSGNVKVAWTDTSRKEGLHWRDVPPDRVARYRDAGEVFDEYDGIILNDARTIWQDQAATRGTAYLDSLVPDYVSVLAETKTPFTFALHGNTYPVKELPFIRALTGLPNFSGAAVQHSPLANAAAGRAWGKIMWVTVPLPYELRWKATPQLTSEILARPIGITGRYSTTKGHHVLAAAAGRGLLPRGRDTWLWGDAVVTRAPSPTLLTFEHLTQGLGLPGTRLEGSVHRPLPWSVDVPERESRVQYHGGYRDGMLAAGGLSLHVDLTAAGYSAGEVEYSQLESIDAGRLQVSVESMWDYGLVGAILPPWKTWPSDAVTTDDHDFCAWLDKLGQAVETSLECSVKTAQNLAQLNRERVKARHDPAKTAATFIVTLGVKEQEAQR